MQNLDPAVQNAGQNFFLPERGHTDELQGEYVASWQRWWPASPITRRCWATTS